MCSWFKFPSLYITCLKGKKKIEVKPIELGGQTFFLGFELSSRVFSNS